MHKPLNPPIRQYVESHTDTITQLTFQDTSEFSLLFSGSTDGLVNTFNTAVEDEDDALVSVINNKSAVQVFTPGIAQNSICILSADEQVAVYSLSEDSTSDADVKPWDLREKFKCDYAISMVNTGPGIVLAVGANKRYGKWRPLSRKLSLTIAAKLRVHLTSISSFLEIPAGQNVWRDCTSSLRYDSTARMVKKW